MRIDSLKNINEVHVGIQVAEEADGDEALELADLFRADLGSAEQPILLAHRNDPQCAFQMIRVHRHVGVCKQKSSDDQNSAVPHSANLSPSSSPSSWWRACA
jgi:hypothetical protein